MRVLHVTETLRGGLCTYLESVVPFQASVPSIEGVWILAPEEDLADSLLQDADSFVYRRGGRDALSLIRFSTTLLRAAHSVQPTIIHLHSSFAGLIGRIIFAPAVLSGRVRLVYTAHGWSFLAVRSEALRSALKRLEKYLSHVNSAIVCVSGAERELAISAGISPKNLHVIHNPPRVFNAPLDFRPSRVAGAVRFLFVGRFDHAKGLDLLLEALSLARVDNWTLDVVGAPVHDVPPYIPEGIADRIKFRGWLKSDELSNVYLDCHCVLIPSRWEAFGLVAVEAMHFGRAVIASNVGGLREIVDHQSTGVLVEPTVDAWVVAIEESSSTTLAAMGQLGWSVVRKRFSAENLNNQLIEMYRYL